MSHLSCCMKLGTVDSGIKYVHLSRTNYRSLCETKFVPQVILNRGDYGEEPRTNFSRTWYHYKHGFGDLHGEFWYGNDFIHRWICQLLLLF